MAISESKFQSFRVHDFQLPVVNLLFEFRMLTEGESWYQFIDELILELNALVEV